MTCTWTEHAARQFEDRQISLRDWINWLFAGAVSLAMWLACALAVVALKPW